MPQAKEKASDGLSIVLSDNRAFYTPGSKISGNVTLNTAQDFAIGSVTVEFYGRVKVHFVQSHGEGESHWRGRAPLFSQSQLLFEGYHTHKPGSFSWPFVVEIPKNPDVAAIRQSKHQWGERDHFLSTDDYIPAHPMPPTFKFRKWGFGYRYHAFVEYVIKVFVKEASGASIVLPASSRKATLPILVRDVASSETDVMSLPCAIQFTIPQQLTEKMKLESSVAGQTGFESHTSRQTVRSSRLLERKQNRALQRTSFSFPNKVRDKAKSVVNPDSLPRFTFDITVSTPESIELLKENAIPILVKVTPVRDDDLTTIPDDNYPDVRIDNINLALEAGTYIRFKSFLRGAAKTKYDIKLLDRHPVDYTFNCSPSTGRQDPVGDNDNEDGMVASSPQNEIDLSKLPGLATALVSAKMGLQTEKPLVPTFNTYIIAREYKLNWKLELDVAGMKVKLSNEDKLRVKVLPPEASALGKILQDADATRAELAEEDGDKDGSDGESAEVKHSKDAKSVLKMISGRRTKQEEVAEEAAATEASASASASNGPLQYRQDEMLPAYQPNPTDFGYRNEIDERPPRYDSE